MKNIYYIHGLNSSRDAFNYLKTQLPRHNHNFIDYDNQTSMKDIFYSAWMLLPEETPITLVGHSLGGVFSVLLANKSKHEYELKNVHIEKVITVASPFSGMSHMNLISRLFRNCDLLKEFSTKSALMKKVNGIIPKVPTLSIITTKGFPGIKQQNDGTITCESMRSINHDNKIEIHSSHTEVMNSHELVNEVRKFVWGR